MEAENVPPEYKQPYIELLEHWKELSILTSLSELLSWDQETYLPRTGISLRAEQQSILARLIHNRKVNDELYRLLQILKDGVESTRISGIAAANIHQAIEEVDRERRVPVRLTEAIAEHASVACEIWREARAKSDFAIFAPALERMITLKIEMAESIGYDRDPYEALFNAFEPSLTLQELDVLFGDLKRKLVPFIQEILARPRQSDTFVFSEAYGVKKQTQLSRLVLEQMGFDFSAGRLDAATHPATYGMGPTDVRLSTRYNKRYLGEAILATIHEGGHGLLEQGINPNFLGLPIGSVKSWGLHESQSRLWEVWIGRSLALWEYLWPSIKKLFPRPTLGKCAHDFFRIVNRVQPSCIRISADPATYNLHVLLRYELERKMIAREVTVSELPHLWNALMREYIGIVPPNDAQGVLQDIHWSVGLIGYFPTYTIGNIASAAIFRAAKREIPLDDQIRRGDLRILNNFLREKIYQHGNLYTLKEVLSRLGESLSVNTFMDVLTERMSQVHTL